MTGDIRLDLVAHEAAWRSQFDEESIKLSHALIVTQSRIAHIGSTAVPGLMAVPAIDVMVGVERYPPTPAFVAPLESLAYSACGERGVPGRLHFIKRGAVSFDLHLVQFDNRLWARSLLLRDYLAANVDVASAYEQRKREFIAASNADPVAYAKLKMPLIAQLQDEAARWKLAAALPSVGT